MDVDRELRALFAQRLKTAPLIDSASKLADLDIDSLDLIEMLFVIEDKFDIHVPQSNEQAAAATFGQLCQWIESAIAAKATSGADGLVAGRAPYAAR